MDCIQAVLVYDSGSERLGVFHVVKHVDLQVAPLRHLLECRVSSGTFLVDEGTDVDLGDARVAQIVVSAEFVDI